MIDTYILQNIIQWLSQSVEFNDMIRCLRDNEEESFVDIDIRDRYDQDDKFYLHVEDIVYSSTETRVLYPFVGIDFGSYNSNVCDGCGVDINVFFQILVKKCSPEHCGTEDGGCSVPVGDPRLKINEIACYLTKMFDFYKKNSQDEVYRTNIFNELNCSEQSYKDCFTGHDIFGAWGYNVEAELKSAPIIGELISREDGIFIQNITIPLKVNRIYNDCESCNKCVCDFNF